MFIFMYHLLFYLLIFREKGGAYGTGVIHKGGIFSLYSYRYCMPLLLPLLLSIICTYIFYPITKCSVIFNASISVKWRRNHCGHYGLGHTVFLVKEMQNKINYNACIAGATHCN